MPSSRRPLAALAALVLALASLAACGAEGPFTVDASARQTLDKAIAPGTPDLRVRVEMFNGSIEVRAGAADRVVATVETTGVGATQADAEADRAKIRVSLDVNPDGSVLLRAVYQPSPDSPENRSARAFVEVPPGAALDLRTSNGAVTAAGIRGAVDVRTSNGSVTLAGLRSGAIVRTSNGTVDLAGGGLLDVESSNAKVAIRGTSATVRVHTSNGDVSFEGTFSSGAQDLETSNGPVTVRLSPDSSFRLDAATSNGTVTVDGFAITTTDPVDADALHGTVGTGGPSIILRTSNASIVVSAVIVERP